MSSATTGPRDRARSKEGGGGRSDEGGKSHHQGGGRGGAKSRSRNNSYGEGKPKDSNKSRSRTNSFGEMKPKRVSGGGVKSRGGGGLRGRGRGRKPVKPVGDYEDEELRTVYIGFVERRTTERELLYHFKDSGEVERVTIKDGFAFMLFKEEKSVKLACSLDGSSLRGLNLRVAPRREKPPEIDGEVLLELDMKKIRNEKQEPVIGDIDDVVSTFKCVGSFSQDNKEANAIIVPGCPPVLDWNKMEAEEGEISLIRQAENAPELNTLDSILKSVGQCSPNLDMSKVQLVANRQCLMKFLAPVDSSIEYKSNKCFRITAYKSNSGPIFLNLESKWHPTMGTAKSFQDSVTVPVPQKVKNLAYPGIFYRINTFNLGGTNIMVRTQVHAEDAEPMLEFGSDSEDFSGGGGNPEGNSDDFFDIEERNGDDKAEDKPAKASKPDDGSRSTSKTIEKVALKLGELNVGAAEFVPPNYKWNTFEGTDLKWVKNDGLFYIPESRYEVKTVDIGGSFWEYNAGKTFFQMLLGGVDYLLLGVLLNNIYVINREEYDLHEVHAKVLSGKNPTNAIQVLSRLEKILAKIVELATPLTSEECLEIVFDGKTDRLTFYKSKRNSQAQ